MLGFAPLATVPLASLPVTVIAAVIGNGAGVAPALTLSSPVASASGAQTISDVTGTGAATAPALTLGAPTAAGTGQHTAGGVTPDIVRSLRIAVDRKDLTIAVDRKDLTIAVDRKDLTIAGLFDGVLNMKRLPNKTPEERWLVKVDIPNWMNEDYTPVSANVDAVSSGVIVSDISLNTNDITFIIEEDSTVGEKLLRASVVFTEEDQVFTEDIKFTVVP